MTLIQPHDKVVYRNLLATCGQVLGSHGGVRATRVLRVAKQKCDSQRSRSKRLSCSASAGTYAEVASGVGSAIISTLQMADPQASQLQTFLDSPSDVAGGALALTYFCFLTPGVLSGYFDMFVVSNLQRLTQPKFKVSDFELVSQLGKGNFGAVFQAIYLKTGSIDTMSEESMKANRVVVKLVNTCKEGVRKDFLKRGTMARGAAETGVAEGYCNALLARAAPGACATFLGDFVADETRGRFKRGEQFLVWKYESDATLEDFIENRVPGAFPENLASFFLSERELNLEPAQANAVLVQKVMRAMLVSLKRIHKTGIVHRDVKPSNILITASGNLKIIDLGAATDLRMGINFNPRSGMLDPEYAPPEELVVPESTPRAPPPVVAAALSPLFFLVTAPDRFDTFSAGMIMLQLSVPEFRTFSGLRGLRRELKACDWDLPMWRESNYPLAKKANLTVLDLKNGAGWDLVSKLVTVRASGTNRGRLSAEGALRHPFFSGKAY